MCVLALGLIYGVKRVQPACNLLKEWEKMTHAEKERRRESVFINKTNLLSRDGLMARDLGMYNFVFFDSE